jgi:circadian clock protein KaiB
LRLYVAGQAPNSLLAIANIKAICLAHFPDAYELEVIDLLDNPRQALADGVIVTPTLVKLLPLPVQKVIGNLSETNNVVRTLAGR